MTLIETKTIIDVTKPPYCADNTGKTDCTKILRQILDEILIREVEGLKAVHDKIIEESDNGEENVYIGLESGRMQNGHLWITFPGYLPSTRIIYFPNGTYKVSDTITYTLENLKNYYYSIPYYENNRNIQFWGEDKDKTVIKLTDSSLGFEKDQEKPLISFINNEEKRPRKEEVTNASFMNIIKDITLDCGKGNPGAIGIKYSSSNIGRIENVDIKTESGKFGIYMLRPSQGVFDNIKISSFDYGMNIAYTSMVLLDGIDLCENKRAGIFTHNAAINAVNLSSGTIPTVEFAEGTGTYYFVDSDITFANPTSGNHVYFEKDFPFNRAMSIPKNDADNSDFAYVDDFGAIGDYKTDSTRAIQRAMNSGKSTIIFGEGQYLINAKIKIPITVRKVDFMFCSLATGVRLIGGEYDSAFEISEDSNELITIENLFAWEQFRGNIRCFKHAAKRNVVFRNIQLMTASMYFNSVRGSKVYFDNCFLTTGTYTRDAWIPGKGFVPVYSHILPYEFHGQTVYGRQVNAERADLHILNDGSDVLLDCFRTEGPGSAINTINSGKTRVNLFSAGIGCKEAENPLFEVNESTLELIGLRALGHSEETEYNIIIKDTTSNKTSTIKWEDCSDANKGLLTNKRAKLIHHYNNVSEGR